MAYKGTVFKVKPHSLIVATEEFEFKEITRHGHARPGQEITFEPGDILQTRNHKKKTPVAIVASILVILLISTGMFRHFFVSDVYAYVGMDINPSIELAINKYLKVSDAEARDADAQKILQNTSLTGLEISQAISTVLKTCSDLGYINDTTSDIMITTTINTLNKNESGEKQTIKEKDDWTINLETQIISGTQEELQSKPQDVNVYIVNIAPEERTQALNKGVSTGRYFLWNIAKENSSDLTLDMINKQSISESVRNNDSIRTVLDNSAVRKWNKSDLTSRSKSNFNLRQKTVKELKPVISLKNNANSNSSNNKINHKINSSGNSSINSFINSRINNNNNNSINSYTNSRINNNSNNDVNSYFDNRINNVNNSSINSYINRNNNNGNRSINSKNSDSNSDRDNLKPSGFNSNLQLQKDEKPQLEKDREPKLDNSHRQGTDRKKNNKQNLNKGKENTSEKPKSTLNVPQRIQSAPSVNIEKRKNNSSYYIPLESTERQRDNSLSFPGYQNQNMQYPYKNPYGSRYNENRSANLPGDLSETKGANSRPTRN